MADKKNEDYVVRMGENAFGKEKDPFMGRRPANRKTIPIGNQGLSQLDNSAPISITAYCLSSISMTVVNKYVVSGTFWNLNFFYLAVQVSRCRPYARLVGAVLTVIVHRPWSASPLLRHASRWA